MSYDMTEKLAEAWKFYDALLDKRIEKISQLSGVPTDKMVKINPAEFVIKLRDQEIRGHKFQLVKNWIKANKTDDNYLISPLDDPVKTANQIQYKEKIGNTRVRASKCEVLPISSDIALDFYRRNHRQSLPNLTEKALSFGLTLQGRLVGAMTYDKTAGAVRGGSKKDMFELMRLAFAHQYSIAGGASRLQKHCEQALKAIGQKKIFSYSNATINSGKVYQALGFEEKSIDGGQPYALMDDFRLIRLVNLHPYSTDKSLAMNGRFKTHLGGNKLWTKVL